MNAWIEMFSGTSVDLLDPNPETIRLDDITHHLARIYRRGTELSTAVHSLCVATLVPKRHRLEALLYKAHTAYVGDVPSSMKLAMRWTSRHYESSDFSYIEDRIKKTIRIKYGLPLKLSEEVKRAARVMAATERKRFLPNTGEHEWIPPLPEPTDDPWVAHWLLNYLGESPTVVAQRFAREIASAMEPNVQEAP